MSEAHSLAAYLNEQQHAAVTAPRQNMLIVAGAGTGKTRVLVSRTAWLLAVEEIPARRILAVTFTNKAAAEMRTRIEAMHLEGIDLTGLWCGTFHSICGRFLRSYALQADLSPGFTILDVQGQTDLIKHLINQGVSAAKDRAKLDLLPSAQRAEMLRLNDIHFRMKNCDMKPAQLAARISALKEAGLRAKEASKLLRGSLADNEDGIVADFYPFYERACQAGNQVDFSEMLLRTVELFETHPELRALQQRRFAEILVDEFQDTNSLQYRLIKLLKGPDNHIFAVGDDDQSIYGWRGADYRNLRNFEQDFAPVKLFKLEYNYRSTSEILAAANALIAHNPERLTDKQLRSIVGGGAKVYLLEGWDGMDEARRIARRIKRLLADGADPSHIAILYRNNSRSGNLEQALSAAGIKYSIYGGLRFFDRKEVQDALAYLRLAVNPSDDAAFNRIINVPPRGMGTAKVRLLEQIAGERRCSLMQALKLTLDYMAQGGEAGREIKALVRAARPFYQLMDKLQQSIKQEADPDVLLTQILEQSGLYHYYQQIDEKEQSREDSGRRANLDELISNAQVIAAQEQRAPTTDAQGRPFGPVIAFLSNAALMGSGELDENGSAAANTGRVRLFTIHAAKGLEFDTVFISGFEQGLLPFTFSRTEDREAEERRLAYVAITRAKKLLFLCWAQKGFSYSAGITEAGPSPFVEEMLRALGRPNISRIFVRCAS